MFAYWRYTKIFVWVQVSYLGLCTALGLDLSPWLPKDKPMELNRELGVRIVSGLKIIKAPLESWELSSAVEVTTDSSKNILICGPGYIHKLELNGQAYEKVEETIPFTNLSLNYHDILSVGEDLYACADDGLWRFKDRDGDGKSDGKPTRMQEWAIEKNGRLKMVLSHQKEILISGNWKWVGKPIDKNEGGKIFRYDFLKNKLSVYADGFHRPIAMSRNLYGDTFCYDMGQSNGRGLPESISSKFYHVAPNGFHGFSERAGFTHFRNGHYGYSAPFVHFSGLNEYTDLEEYRHYHLPPDFFYGGLFGCDWLGGKLIYFQLNPDDSSYTPRPFIVAETQERSGWSPRMVCVTPEGKLLVISSGLSGPGGLFLIQSEIPYSEPEPENEIAAAITPPQPYSSWSYKEWTPLAKAIEDDAFLEILIREKPSLLEKLAALDCLLEKGYSFERTLLSELKLVLNEEAFGYYAQRFYLDHSPRPSETWVSDLLFSQSKFNVRKALDIFNQNPEWIGKEEHIKRIIELSLYMDRGIKSRARRLLQSIPLDKLEKLMKKFDSLPLATQVLLFPKYGEWVGTDNNHSITEISKIIQSTRNLDTLTDCLSGIFRDFKLTPEEFYLLSQPVRSFDPNLRETIKEKAIDLFPTARAELNIELSRLIAILGINETILDQRLYNQINPGFPFSKNIHYLRVAMVIDGQNEVPKRFRKRIAQTILKISRALNNKTSLTNQKRLHEIRRLFATCFEKWEWLETSVSQLPDFPSEKDGMVLQFIKPPKLDAYVTTVFDEIKSPLLFDYDKELIRAFTKAKLPNKVNTIGQLWNNLNLRKPLLEYLSQNPQTNFLNAFLESLDNGDPECQYYALKGITSISPSPTLSAPQLAMLVRSASRESTPLSGEVKAKTLNLIAKHIPGGHDSDIETEKLSDLPSDQFKIELMNQFLKFFPGQEKYLGLDPNDDPAVWKDKMKTAEFDKGNPVAGKFIFTQRTCLKCHGQKSNFGPPLRDISRMTSEEILEHTIFPHKSVAEEYKTWMVQSGQIKFMGFRIATSDKDVIFTINGQSSVRLKIKDLNLAEPASFSLMPGGLLAGLSKEQIVDLISYIKSAKTTE